MFFPIILLGFINLIYGQKLYVYEDPAVDWSYLLDCYEEQNGSSILMDERSERGQNSGEIWMHKSALLYENRVYDPLEADLYYVPMYIAVSSNMDFRGGSLMCQGLTHSERLEKALDFITKSESYIIRAGSDHILTCTWFWCGNAFGNHARVVFQRSIIGINEHNNQWAKWECLNKIVTVPYTPNSILSRPENVLKTDDTFLPREIPFYFSGSSRDRIERLNLRIVNDLIPESQISVSDNWFTWSETPEEFADNIMNSRFCFIPRGDTLSSRRLFDSILAGCIPILTTVQVENGMVPFEDELDYNEFCILVKEKTFLSMERIRTLVSRLSDMGETEYLEKRRNLHVAREHLIYGTTGDSFVPNVKVFNTFMKVVAKKEIWDCNPTPFYKTHAERVSTLFFPPNPNEESVKDWVLEKESMVNRQHGILMCSPPFTNSELLVKEFMLSLQEHEETTWTPEHDWENDGVDFLKVTDYSFYDIFEGIDWIKTIFYRDPVIRILDAFTSTNSMDAGEFRNFVEYLYETNDFNLESDYRPISRHCGFRYSHYPTSLRADDEDVNSRFMGKLPRVMKSLEDKVNLYEHDSVKEKLVSCEWAHFYDLETIRLVYEIYNDDYVSFGISKNWVEIIGNCGG